MNKKITYSGILLFLIAILVSPSFSQSIPEPTPKIQCSYDGNWYSPEDYKIYCKPPSTSGRTSTSSPGLTPSQQMQLQMFQGIMAPLFGALGQMIHDSMMNLMMPKPDTSYQQRQQEEALRKQQEEAKKKAYEAWQRHMKEAEEQA
jgi:hypothetical protein